MKNKHLPLVLGFVFITSFLFAQDYYWRAEQGQGEWSDVNNWRTSTGQTPVEIPSESNTVIFDGESFLNPFDTLFINSQNPTCKSIRFINIPFEIVIFGGSQITDFLVFGSFISHQNVINDYHGNYVFMSQEAGNVIRSEGSRFTGDLKFEGIGEWTLMDDLYVFIDTVSWEEIVFVTSDTDCENDTIVFDYGPKIHHKSGTLISDGHSINCRGFRTSGSLTRTLNITNTEVTVIGAWNLTGQGLEFIADGSLINIGGPNAGMTNVSGDEIYFHDIVVYPFQYKIENNNIRTHHRKVHFLGAGSMEGKAAPTAGSFTVDTLIYEGAFDCMTGMPIPCDLVGPYHNIHYTQCVLTHGIFELKDGFFHRIDFDGAMFPDIIRGRNNEYDSVFYNFNGGTLSGIHTVNNIVQFDSAGIIGAEREFSNTINHAVFKHDGIMAGTNFIDSLTLGSGYWYKMSADSLLPSGENAHTFIQHVGFIEVEGECSGGNTILSSAKFQTRAVLNYYGGALEANYLTIRDLKNLNPSVPIVVNNGIDAGNNIGFDITNPDPRDFYWINGGGNWSDTEHWSLSSGGPSMSLCVPTPLDNVIFDANAGFTAADSVVMIDINHPTFNEFIWKDNIQNLPVMPVISGTSEKSILSWGDFILNKYMSWQFMGELYFVSDNDQEWEQVHIEYTFPDVGVGNWIFAKTFFWGDMGKWELTSDLFTFDTLFLYSGELLTNKTQLDIFNFNADDTLRKGLYLIDSTLVQIHQYQADGWIFNGYKMNEKTFLDAGWSTIRLLGDNAPPLGQPPGNCNMTTFGAGADPVIYHNVEFGLPNLPGEPPNMTVEGELRSFTFCKYNLVDYYSFGGNATSAGEPSIIDTLTFKGGDGFSACRINDKYRINFLIAEQPGDTIIGTHIIDTALFYKQGSFLGFSDIGYLEADEDMQIEGINNVTHGVYHGNSVHLGKNTFKKLELSPDKINSFAPANDPEVENITIITHDLISVGECDKPIRIQSESPGNQAQIYYEMIDPTNDFTARYSSIKDIEILGGQTYLAEESIDLGNNTGWTWVETVDTMYYWIGGQGSWDLSSNWSRESGGAAIDGCVPREIVHVIFDDNSFNSPNDTVFADTLNAYCKDMLWLQDTSLYKPTFFSTKKSGSELYVYGSMILSPGMDWKFEGEIFFDNIKSNKPDSIRSAGNIIRNHIRMQGIGDYIYLADDLEVLLDTAGPDKVYGSVFLTHGGIDLNGFELECAGFFSTFPNDRIINIENSNVILKYNNNEAWHVDGENLELNASNSTINFVNINAIMLTEHGGFDNVLQYHNIVLDSIFVSIENTGNITGYNIITANSMSGQVKGNYIADTVLMIGSSSTMLDKSTTNVVIVDSSSCEIAGNHDIKRVLVNVGKTTISGSNYIEYCYFNAKGEFRGENTFDTLLLFAGTAEEKELGKEGQGNIYIFESTKTQTVMDSLFIRGNPCANLTIRSSIPNNEAFIKKDYGHDVVCDFLILQDVAVTSKQIVFYAGGYSSAIPDPNQPPAGWLMQDAENYEFGFGNGKAIQFCKGETVLIDGANFNAGPTAEYFWNGADVPGGQFFAADSAGQYALRVYYSPSCYQTDYINLETLETPEAMVDPGPYCEGEPIIAVVNPEDKTYNYTWFNGEQGKQIIAETYINSVYVTVENPINKCKTTTTQAVVVKPAPDPEAYLGDPVTVKYGDSFTLDAGIGDTYQWYSHPHTDIIPDNEQFITVNHTEYEDLPFGDIEYYVLVDLDGCQKEGFLKNELLPPSKIGVPTAFSPNGDNNNDELKIKGVEEGFAEMDLKIYNRYGKLVYESNDWTMGWDGTYNGKKQEMDVYTYYIKVRFQDEAVVEEKGNITLLR